jgi:hypothetical protein
LHDEAGFLGGGHELVGRDHPALGIYRHPNYDWVTSAVGRSAPRASAALALLDRLIVLAMF